ncbi:hypothetical protein ACIRVF_24110 [Kitasatospora sp. NPDC101157]|uniref:hypothetical protein n=1 Tax=Kitasatospora sp. NPDC101157 TaxID=3364098 RepID=UPI003801E68B
MAEFKQSAGRRPNRQSTRGLAAIAVGSALMLVPLAVSPVSRLRHLPPPAV